MIVIGSGLAAIKLAGIAASSYVVWSTWRSMPESAIRRKLRKLFEDGDLCHKRSRKRGKAPAVEIRKYPAINRVSIYQDCIQCVFTLPDGLDPAEIKRHDWLFRQVFGEHIELAGTSKTFTLNAYTFDAKHFEYDLEMVRKAVGELRLPIYVGRSRRGDVAYDMTEHPHLLIAGETGSGKSVALRSILTTMINVAGERLELYCADLKRSEFHLFRDIAKTVDIETVHLHKTLLKLRKELRRRGDLLDAAGLANVNDLPAGQRPPYIVLAIDEVALLKKERELMEIVEEISAVGRALGMFLILSMQRPDADVLDGKLKNNLTVRMAFRHADEINSRITIGSGEAAEIKQSQKGRMVLKFDGLTIVQGPHLDVPAARSLLAPHKMQKDDKLSSAAQEPAEEDDIELEVLPF